MDARVFLQEIHMPIVNAHDICLIAQKLFKFNIHLFVLTLQDDLERDYPNICSLMRYICMPNIKSLYHITSGVGVALRSGLNIAKHSSKMSWLNMNFLLDDFLLYLDAIK